MPLLTFSSSGFPFVAFTKILSADVNQSFNDIKNCLNWAGTTSTTTGLNDDNIQSITASQGGLTRATKLKAGTANYVLINDSNGAMSEESALAISRGGTGTSLSLGVANAGRGLAVNSAGTALEISASMAGLNVLNYYRFS